MCRLNDQQIEGLLAKARQTEYSVCVWGAGQLGTGPGKKLLEELDIKIDFYCDNNGDWTDRPVVDGIYCRHHSHLIKNNMMTICFILVGYTMMKSVYGQLRELGIMHIVTYEDILGYSMTLKRYFPFMSAKDTVIYTCISGDYDDVREPVYISERCDHYLISEKKPDKETVFQWIDIADVVPAYITDDIYRNRYCKMNASKLFPQYRYSIYVDGNVTITGDIARSIPFLKRTGIAVTAMYEKDTVYMQALRCMLQGMDRPERWQEQMKRYWIQGFPDDIRVYLCNILVRRHNDPVCVRLMEEWWEEFRRSVRRDQISFPYVLWKSGYGADDIAKIDQVLDVKDFLSGDPYWSYHKDHKKKRIYR